MVQTRSSSRVPTDSAGRVNPLPSSSLVNTNVGSASVAPARRTGEGKATSGAGRKDKAVPRGTEQEVLESIEQDVNMPPKVHTRSSSAKAAGDRPSVPPVESFAYGSPGKAITPDPLHTKVATQAPTTAIEAGIQKASKRLTKNLTVVEEEHDEDENDKNDDHGQSGPSGTHGAGGGEQTGIQGRPTGGRRSRSQSPVHGWLPAWLPSCGRVMEALWSMIFLIAALLVLLVAWNAIMTKPPGNPSLADPNTTTRIPDPDHPYAGIPTLGALADYKHLSSRIDVLESRYYNMDLEQKYGKIHKVNYFSTGLGAVVNPYLTSPTKQVVNSLSWKTWFIYNAFRLNLPVAPPPSEALGPWDDIGDCWCAPRNGDNLGGKLQLAVLLPRTIVPTELVVEHIPKDGTLDSGSAPRRIEMWAQIDDPMTREAVTNALFSILPYEGTQPSVLERDAERFDARRALDDSWVRVGSWMYDLYDRRHVQKFTVPVDLEHFGVRTNQVVVRALSNWGDNNYVCLYRLRLHGLLREEDPEYRDSTPKAGKHDPYTPALTLESRVEVETAVTRWL